MQNSPAHDRVQSAYLSIEQSDRPEVWISLRPKSDALAEADALDARRASGEVLPLHGLVVAVKDNIDVAGFATTAGARSYAYMPVEDASAVARLRDAGAIVLGKTNLDQFATGLVGTRSPFGAVRNSVNPERISGGSSSGSAVAVALGFVDLALGTDTAGSGRVPAALNGIWGFKPTRGRIPTSGVVPACRSLDCITVFARDSRLGRLAMSIMTGRDKADPLSREWVPRPKGPITRLAIPTPDELANLAPGWLESFRRVVDTLTAQGISVVERSIAPLLEVASLLYGGAFVAERYAAVGAHLEAHRDLIGTDLDPTVSSIILAARRPSAADLFRDEETRDRIRAETIQLFADVEAILTPTTTLHPTLSDVAADPVGVNSALGRYTNFANLLDMAAVALPAGMVGGLPFGVMLTGAAFDDERLADLAALLERPNLDLIVFGAHLTGQPQNHELLRAGGQFVEEVRTAPLYQMFALPGSPAKPAVVRVNDGGNGVSLSGERWRLPADGLGNFVASLPAPMILGTIELAGTAPTIGLLAETHLIDGSPDISKYGGWREYQDR